MAKDKGVVGTLVAPLNEHDWSAEEELQLFHAMEGLRPVGINKHFYMSCIAERLSKSLNREMPSKLIWRHLGTMYKLKELDDMESLPFPNEEREFSLPEQDYSALLTKKGVDAGEETKDTTIVSNQLPPIHIAIENNGKASTKLIAAPSNQSKDVEKKVTSKLLDPPKRSAKRTRGSISNESTSPSTTPPPMQSNKRRRI